MKPYLTVSQTDEAVPDQAPPNGEGRVREPPSWKRLGTYNIFILAFGTSAVFLAVGFLAFVWAGAGQAIRGGSPPPLWYTIVANKWTTRVVTISSALTRIATAAQLGVFAAVMAALILETAGTSMAELPLLSIIRCVNTGPHSLFRVVASSFKEKGSHIMHSSLIAIAVINGIALQFTSTILLDDFGTASIVLSSESSVIPFGLDSRKSHSNVYQGCNFWKSSPPTYPRFAEYSGAAYEAEGYEDTGKLYRALLPFSSPDERRTLRNFTGIATVMDARVICTKPSFKNLSIGVSNYGDSHPVFYAAGSVEWTQNFPALRQAQYPNRNFHCLIGVSISGNESTWPISLCSLGNNTGEMTEPISSDYAEFFGQSTEAYLLLNSTGNRTDWDIAYSQNGTHTWIKESSGSWTNLHYSNLTVNATLCFTAPVPMNYLINAHSTADYSEPALAWSKFFGTYLTQDIRKMLGATSETFSASDRGLLGLSPPTNWIPRNERWPYNVSAMQFLSYSSRYGFRYQSGKDLVASNESASLLLTSVYSEMWELTVHKSHVAIVQDILKYTGSPAKAIQALFTILTQMAFYDAFPQFDIGDLATSSFSTETAIPTAWKGFIIAITMIFLHFAMVVFAVVSFYLRTELSLLGNSWQTIAQVASEGTADTIMQASMLTDTELRKIFKVEGDPRRRVLIKRSLNGRSETTFQSHERQPSMDA